MDKWKIIAIIFIIISILEFGILYWAWDYGTEEIENENECAINLCEGYETYQYFDKACYCYIDGELTYQEYMG